MLNSSDRIAGILFVFVCIVLTGCSGGKELRPTVTVKGKVTLDEKPFSEAQIWFVSPKSGAGFKTALNEDGTYSLDIEDAHLGETYGVYFGGLEPEEGAVDGAGAPLGPEPPPIPNQYWDATTSGLTANLKEGGDQTFDFDLKSE